MNFYEEAEKKLRGELTKITGAKEGAIKGAVLEALLNFAGQEPEFAQAVVQGGSFADCMRAVCKGVGSSISDLEAYGRAAAFFFPGSKVRFEMHIDLAGETGKDPSTSLRSAQDDRGMEKAKEAGSLVFNLADFL